MVSDGPGVETSLEVDDVYTVTTCGSADDLDRALRRVSSSLRLRDPLALALRGMREILAGDVAGGIAVLSRAADAAEGEQAQYVTELLVPYLISTNDLHRAEVALRRNEATVEELKPAYAALRAVLAARRGQDDRSRDLADAAMDAGRNLDREVLTARILQRVALAATYRQEYQVAQQRALEAARAYERVGSHRHAGGAYSLLYSIASGFLGDLAAAALWAERMTAAGDRAGDFSIANYGLLAQVEIAASSGDHRKLAKLRHRLQLNPLSQQYREHFGDVVAQTLAHLWAGRFDPARATIADATSDPTISLQQRALADALLVLVDLGRWNVDEVRRRAHLVVSASIAPEGLEALYDTRNRRLARVLAASAMIIVGDAARGHRALSREFDPDQFFARVSRNADLREEDAPPLSRGYIRALNVARAHGVERAPRIAGLTATEVAVLRHIARGEIYRDIAVALGRSENTVKNHGRNILLKLNVSTRQKAVERARRLGIDV